MAITSYKAGSAISAGDVVYVSSSGLLIKALGTSRAQAAAVGVAIDTGSTGELVRVNNDSVYTTSLTLTPGSPNYLSLTTSGAIVDYTVWQNQFNALTASGAFLVNIGNALTSTNISVEIQKPIYVTK